MILFTQSSLSSEQEQQQSELEMEQMKYLEKKLNLKYLPDLNTGTSYIKNSDILMAALAVFTFFNLLGYFYPFSVLIFGILLPLFCLANGADIEGYFPILSFLLWVRLWYPHLSGFDAILMVCLWHPNIQWGEAILKRVSKFFRRESLSTKISKAADKLLKND